MYRITATARAVDCHADTLRALEKRGLFTPTRDRAGHRRYSDADLERLRRILYPHTITDDGMDFHTTGNAPRGESDA